MFRNVWNFEIRAIQDIAASELLKSKLALMLIIDEMILSEKIVHPAEEKQGIKWTQSGFASLNLFSKFQISKKRNAAIDPPDYFFFYMSR